MHSACSILLTVDPSNPASVVNFRLVRVGALALVRQE
jgi:hypothetical protein